MWLARVKGAVWGARQAERLTGVKLLITRPLDAGGEELDAEVVAADRLSAGPGDLVLVAESSRARDLTVGAAVPTKAVVIAIVDDLQREGG